jgi:RNA polymerase sigma factor (TIGR02999 family)
MSDENENLTRLLKSMKGDDESVKKLYPIVYNQLHAMAHQQMRKERNGHTLNTTALVHEAYIKLFDYPPDADWDGRNHFFGIAARAMRQVLVNYARSRNAEKRAGYKDIQPFEDEFYLTEEKAGELVKLEEALSILEKMEPRLGKVVECRYFGGYNIDETADILDVSPATVKRDWTSARAWLYSFMNPG